MSTSREHRNRVQLCTIVLVVYIRVWLPIYIENRDVPKWLVKSSDSRGRESFTDADSQLVS